MDTIAGTVVMKWYPWLNTPYRQILSRYQQGCGHHALLLHSQPGNGEISLCYAISRWLMCQYPNGKKSCRTCHSCHLMMAGNHPDFYQLELNNEQHTLGVDSIRIIIDKIYSCANQKGRKVVSLLNTDQLTEQAANALLKIVEEPPKETYFLMICRVPVRLLPTLRSRCLYWYLPSPNEELGLLWLKHKGIDDFLSASTALRLCANAPLAAEALLQPARWQTRLKLCTELQDALINNDFLSLLPMLNRDKNNEPLHWLLSLLTDALKWQHKAHKYLVNADRMSLVTALSVRWPSSVLHTQWQQWLLYLRQCQEIDGLNRELLLTHCLLNWEQSIADAYIF